MKMTSHYRITKFTIPPCTHQPDEVSRVKSAAINKLQLNCANYRGLPPDRVPVAQST